MELDLTTIVLEILNFLVLVWLLKRFLYQPVLKVIDQRQQSINNTLAEAQQTRQQAESLQQQYEERLAHWQQEKTQAQQELAESINQQRAEQLTQLEQELADLKEKHQASNKAQHEQWQHHVVSQAIEYGAAFAGKLLTPLADAELEQKLVRLFCQQVSEWSPEACAQFCSSHSLQGRGVTVYTAYALDATLQQALQQTLQQLFGQTLSVEFAQQAELLAGVRIAAGAWTLGLNLADELRGFSDTLHH